MSHRPEKGAPTSRSEWRLVALSDKYGQPGNIDRTLKMIIRLSPVPLRKNTETGPSGESAPFCPRVISLSAYRPEGWLVGAVGIEPTTFGLKGRCSTTELRP